MALYSLHNIVTLFHTISICPPFSCPPSPYWDIRHVDHANPPSFPPFHFHALSVPPRARGARSSSCRRRNPSRVLPSASLTNRLVHVRTHNPAEMGNDVRQTFRYISLSNCTWHRYQPGAFLLRLLYTLCLFITCHELQTSSANLRPFVKDYIAPYNFYNFSAFSTTYFCASLVKTLS